MFSRQSTCYLSLESSNAEQLPSWKLVLFPSCSEGTRFLSLYFNSFQHAEEMKLICAALEAEGYGPSQVSGDEVIRHLWWEKENMRKGSGKGGGTGKDAAENLPQLFQVCVCVCMC